MDKEEIFQNLRKDFPDAYPNFDSTENTKLPDYCTLKIRLANSVEKAFVQVKKERIKILSRCLSEEDRKKLDETKKFSISEPRGKKQKGTLNATYEIKSKEDYDFFLSYVRKSYEYRVKGTTPTQPKTEEKTSEMTKDYARLLEISHNLILHGAPGTGKTYLAKEIAKKLTDGNEEQIGFVQFHPSYDYTDFVEGLRPKLDDNDQMVFNRQDGIFKAFCKKAKEAGQVGGQDNFDETWDNYLEFINNSEEQEQMTPSTYLTVNSRQNLSINYITRSQGNTLPRQYVYELYKNPDYSQQTYYRHQGRHVLNRLKDFGLKAYKAPNANQKTDKKFVFIIDEINRGEMSKIFGELFFAIDPGYRGEKGAVTTQYANMDDSTEPFYIPENVYIIGTMNDIDRSVDTFDFAMRRRFRFVEVTAEKSLGMWDGILSEKQLDEAKDRLTKLNQAIENIEELNRNYHVGPSYFLTLPDLDYDYDTLWQDYLEPLLAEYLRGTYNEGENLARLQRAYNREE